MPSERPKRVAITGGFGFLGWHTACRLRAIHNAIPIRLGRQHLGDPVALARALRDVDAVIHVAGVNRAESDEAIEEGNKEAAQVVANALATRDDPVPVTYANSIQVDRDNAYGRGKKSAAHILIAGQDGPVANVLLPNLFGEHGRPDYNSFVATFAHSVAAGHEPNVTDDRPIPLMHAQRAAEHLISAALSGEGGERRPPGDPHRVKEVRDRLQDIHRIYATGDIPPLRTEFDVDLFNTYRSYRFPKMFPMAPQIHEDRRGRLFETVRSHGGTGQAFVSTTKPGQTRGGHYHMRKFERFFVVSGEAEIRLRRLLHKEVVTFRLSGETPSYVDMPTLWVHDIHNVGDSELITMFWSDQLLDPEDPDQYTELVDEWQAVSA